MPKCPGPSIESLEPCPRNAEGGKRGGRCQHCLWAYTKRVNSLREKAEREEERRHVEVGGAVGGFAGAHAVFKQMMRSEWSL